MLSMKVVAYSIKPFEKEFLARANQKKHDITLISNSLSVETAHYAEGKDAVIVFTSDDVSEQVIDLLIGMGIKFITTRSVATDYIDKQAAAKHNIKLANVPETREAHYQTHEYLQHTANQIIRNLDMWQQDKCVGKACISTKNCRGKKEEA